MNELPAEKACTKCNNVFNQDMYKIIKRKSGKLSLNSWCKICTNRSISEYTKKRALEVKVCPTEKLCKRCNILYSIDNFTLCKSRKDGHAVYCKNCTREQGKLSYHMNREVDPNNLSISEQICSVCLQCLPVDSFTKKLNSSNGISNICSVCANTKSRNINWNTPENKSKYHKRYYDNNLEKLKDKWKKQSQTISRKLRISQNSRIRSALKKYDIQKSDHTIEYLGCSIEFFRSWFEFLFADGMSWENMSTWHIDHVTPVDSFDLRNDDDRKKCFHWTNIQPLFKNDNLKKSNKIDEEMIEQHKQKVKTFISAQVKEGDLLETPESL